MKNKDIHIRISDERLRLIKKLANKEYRTITAIIDMALDLFFKQKRNYLEE